MGQLLDSLHYHHQKLSFEDLCRRRGPQHWSFSVIIIHSLGRHRSVVCGWKKGKGRAWRALVPHHATTVMIARPRFLELGETAYFWWDSIL